MTVEMAVLNGPQAAAASHVTGPMVVFAGAGSGKTRVLTHRIASLLAKEHVPPYRILAVTFTNKAAGEMKRRLERLVGAELAKDLWIGTFHGICLRLLRRHADAAGLASGFSIYDGDDQHAVLTRVYKELRVDAKKHAVRDVLGRIHREKQDGLTAAEFVPRNDTEEVVARCFAAYERRLKDANAVDFDDLLIKVVNLAEEPDGQVAEELRRKFQHVLVDEFQDVNRVQYRLVRALSRLSGNLFVVGDDDQSIYRWRGADVRIVRNFRRDHPSAQVVRLEENYRSSGNVVAAALGVIQPALDREPKELWTSNPAGDRVRVVECTNERDEARFVTGQVARLVDAGVSLEDIAVFYRVHAQSRVLEEAFRSERIPYQVIGGARFFERAEIKDLLGYLRVIVNPRSDLDLVRIINVPGRKIGDTTVERLAAMAAQMQVPLWEAIIPLAESDRVGPQARRALGHFHALMSDFMEVAATASPHDLADRVLDETGYRAMLAAEGTDEAEGRGLNLDELLGSIEEYEREILSQGEEVPNLAGFLERAALTASVDEMKDVPKVSLMTVHAAKGLEFEAVFLTGMEEDMFPFGSLDDKRTRDLEEERRLAYVAITRARRRLTLTHTLHRTIFAIQKYGRPSRFLEDLPRGVIENAKTEAARSGSGRFIDRDFGPSAVPRGPAWTHPQAMRPVTATPPRSAYEPGERFVERDDDAGEVRPRAAPPPRPRDRGAEVGRGARVHHKLFGEGVVVEIEEPMADPTATVQFASASQPKRVKVRYLEVR